MAQDFRLIKTYSGRAPMKTLEKASATVIEAGDMVTLDAGGLAIKAVAASTRIAYAMADAVAGDLSVMILDDPKAEFEGTAAANFAKANRGLVCDISGTTNLLINTAASATGVLEVSPSDDAGTVGSTANVRVRINKPLY